MNTGPSLATIIHAGIARLQSAGIDSAALDARLLIGHVLGLDRAALLGQSERVLTNAETGTIATLIDRRAAHESVARIVGFREFYGLPFALNEATLEPRPDSETLVDAALALQPNATSILDLGTGSGCLLLSLLHALPNARGLGIDIAPRAIAQASANAAALNLAARAAFRTGDWLTGVTDRFDLVISNPPYVTTAEMTALMPEVRNYDPPRALDGGPDGLDPYRHLIPALPAFMTAGAVVVMEVGHTQAAAVATLFDQCFTDGKKSFADIATHRDLGGHTRCVSARRADPA